MIKMTKPAASVVMTTYNGEHYLKETLDSILTQTFTQFELIIVDDCSQDDTISIINNYSDPRIKLIQNEKNLGISCSRNKGLKLAQGEFIFACDHDDLSLPDRLKTQIAFMQSHPQVSMVACSAKEWRDGVVRSFYQAETRPYILHWRLFSRCNIVHSSVCMRASILNKYGLGYDPEYHYAEDYVLFHRLAEFGDITIMPDELVIYREHESNASRHYHAEMAENGKRFLLHQFDAVLACSVDEKKLELYWDVFVEGGLVSNPTTLKRVGKIYFSGLDAYFLYKKDLTDGQRQELLVFAEQDWWRIVCKHVSGAGRFDFFAVFSDVMQNDRRFLSWVDVLRCSVRVMLKTLRKAIYK